jgi:cytidyltransferase-like protein
MKSKVLIENWKRFLNEANDFESQYDVGLVPMSAKPFHEGHMSLVRKASDECKDVIIFVSTSDRKRKGEISIYGEDMKFIWENILIKYLPPNCICEFGGSPISKTYKKLEEGLTNTNTYAIYTGEEDQNRFQSKYYIDMIDRVYIRPLVRGEDTKAISGTLMRSYLSNAAEDKFLFLDGLPSEISDDDKQEIFNILFRRLN